MKNGKIDQKYKRNKKEKVLSRKNSYLLCIKFAINILTFSWKSANKKIKFSKKCSIFDKTKFLKN